MATNGNVSKMAQYLSGLGSLTEGQEVWLSQHAQGANGLDSAAKFGGKVFVAKGLMKSLDPELPTAWATATGSETPVVQSKKVITPRFVLSAEEQALEAQVKAAEAQVKAASVAEAKAIYLTSLRTRLAALTKK